LRANQRAARSSDHIARRDSQRGGGRGACAREKAGLDPALTLKVIADGAGASRMLQVRGPMMVKRDYSNATMKLDVWQKDMTVIAEFAREIGCPTPLFAAAAPFYLAALAMRPPDEDTGAVHAVLEGMAAASGRLEKWKSGKVSSKSKVLSRNVESKMCRLHLKLTFHFPLST
jgi:hypothetical protein